MEVEGRLLVFVGWDRGEEEDERERNGEIRKRNGLSLWTSGDDPSVARALLIKRVRSCGELHWVEWFMKSSMLHMSNE